MTTTAHIQTIVNSFRQQLLRNEAHAEQALNRAHAHTLAVIQPALNKLYEQLAEKMANGEQIPASWIYEQLRLEHIQLLIQRNIDQYAALALQQARINQHVGVQLGQQSGMQQLQATVPAGVHYTFGIPSQKAINDIVGATQAGSPLSDLFNGFGQEAATKASQALVTGITLGQNPRRIASQVQDALGISRARALTICRDQLNNAYRRAAMETYRANDDVVEGMVRIAALSARSCAACIALNGKVYKLDEDPGFHPNDRCALAPLTKSWDSILGKLGISSEGIPDTRIQVQSGSDWFDQQDAETQQKILGSKTAYDLWAKNDNVSLQDFVQHTYDQDWGAGVQVRSVAKVKAMVK